MINQSRLTFVKELESFLDSKQKELNSVLDTLGWTEDSIKDEVKVCCPENPGHWIPESALPHHKEICKLVKEGYQKEELEKQPPDSTFFYEKTSNVIPVVLDQPILERIISENGFNMGNTSKEFPKTVDRWSIEFTPEQRVAIYDFIINASKTAEKPKNVTLEDLMMDFEKREEQEEKPKSQLELLAEMRDYKRRRQSYRAKNVHITKKSYTEIMREVIENQTNYLMEIGKSEEEKHEDSNDNKRQYTHDSDNYDSSGDASSKYRDHHSRHKRDDYDNYDSSGDVSSKYRDHHSRHKRDDYDSNYYSKHKSSKHYSPKRKKHKRDRSRSRSPSHRKHKKSHKKKSHHD